MTLIEEINRGSLDRTFHALYGQAADIPAQRKRYVDAIRKNGPDTRFLFSAAGRTELAGNHTDHNLGVVLAASINLDTIAAVSISEDNRAYLESDGHEPVHISLDDLSIHEEERGRTSALLRGIAKGFNDLGYQVGGFRAHTTSSVLKGSGLSSSAAIEVLIGEIFNHLYAHDALSPVDIAKIGQFAENQYFGKPCGLMDQIACAHGGIVSIDFADAGKPRVKGISFSFDDPSHGHAIVVVDTGGNHADLTEHYAAIPQEMRAVAALLGKTTLSQVKPSEFMRKLPSLRARLGNDRALIRAMHFLRETKRAREMYKLLKDDDFKRYLQSVRESGRSSFEYLQNVFCASDPAHQGLSLALCLCDEILREEGAFRVHGGGFAGTIQAYVPLRMLKRFESGMEKVFGKGCCTVLSIRQRPVCCIAESK